MTFKIKWFPRRTGCSVCQNYFLKSHYSWYSGVLHFHHNLISFLSFMTENTFSVIICIVISHHINDLFLRNCCAITVTVLIGKWNTCHLLFKVCNWKNPNTSATWWKGEKSWESELDALFIFRKSLKFLISHHGVLKH